MSSKATYQTLPKEVLSVGHRIGLKQKNDKHIIESYVENVVPKTVVDREEFRFNTYLLDDKQKPFNGKQKQKKSKNGLKAKQRKSLFKWNRNDIKYKTFEKINILWNKYIDSVINEIKSKSDQIKLIRADFHGSYFIVFAAKNPTLVGIKGFVVQETKNVIKIVTKDNRLLVIPKDGTVFAFEHNHNIYKLNGYNMIMSSHHRSKAKPKIRSNPILIDI